MASVARLRVLALIAVAVLSACGGGATTTPHAASTGLASVSVKISIPSLQGTASRRRVKYISPSTQSVTIAVNGGAPNVVNLTPSSPNCSAGPQLVCTASFTAPPGPRDAFVFDLYDGLSGSGNVLASSTLVSAITFEGPNVLNVVLNGVVNSISLELTTASLPAGAAGTTSLVVSALDSDGNVIIGPGSYSDVNGNALTINLAATQATPTIKSPYTAGAATLATTSLTGPAAAIPVSYNGYALLSTQFTATVTGGAAVAPATATLTLTPTIYEYPLANGALAYYMTVGPDKQIWVAEFTAQALVHFVPVPPGQAGLNAATLPTPSTNIDVTTGSDGNIWFTDWSTNVHKVAPTATQLSQIVTFTLPTSQAWAIADGGDGNMYVDYSYYDGPDKFPINSAPGVVTPTDYTFGGGNSAVLGPDGRMWFVDGQQGCCYIEYIQAYHTAVSANQTDTTFDFGGGMAGYGLQELRNGADGNMWYVEKASNVIGRISPSASNASQRVDLPLAAGSNPTSIAAGTDGFMYFSEVGPPAKIGRVPTTATAGNLGLVEYAVPSGPTIMYSIIAGPDGNMWFDETNPDKVGKLAL